MNLYTLVRKGRGRRPGAILKRRAPRRTPLGKRRAQAHPRDTTLLVTTAGCKHTWVLVVHGLVDDGQPVIIRVGRLIEAAV